MKKYDPVKRLEARTKIDARKMLEMLSHNAARVKGLIIGAKDVQQARGREALFREITAAFRVLGGNMDDLLKECAAATAMASAKAVGQSLVDKAKEAGNSILKFSMERAKRYWRYVCPENSRGLAATGTDKMNADLIDALRRAVVEVERQAAIDGWTMDEIRKAIEDKWAELSKNDKNFKFVDKSGRAWENGRYCQMLARTTATRVWNDSYLDRLAEEGFNLVKVSQHGSEPDCEVCRAWAGKICIIAGKSDKYPTVEDARAAGVFHPNCMCTWEYVDEDEDKAELEKQARKAGEEPGAEGEEAGKREESKGGEAEKEQEPLKDTTSPVRDAIEHVAPNFDAIARAAVPKSIAERDRRLERAEQAMFQRARERKAAEAATRKAHREWAKHYGDPAYDAKLLEARRAESKANNRYVRAWLLHDKIREKFMAEAVPWATGLIAHGGEKCEVKTGTASRLLPRWPKAKETLEKIVSKDVFPSREINVFKIQGRAFCRGADIKLTDKDHVPTFVHESMHFIEHFNAHVHARCSEFLNLRAGGERPRPLSELTGNPWFGSNERARPDKFFNAYCGKVYWSASGPPPTEILSMGVERLLRNPVRFLKEDREYATLCLALIRGQI